MANLSSDGRVLTMTFPGWERLFAGADRYEVPARAITAVELLDGWTSEILGSRRGLVISGYQKLGRFRHPSGVRRLVSMRRGLPLLRVGLRDCEFDELLISATDGVRLAERLAAGRREQAAR